MQALMLSDNKITSVGCLELVKLLQQTSTLQELQLQNNDIDNEGGKALVAHQKRSKILKLEVENNRIAGTILQELLSFMPMQKLHLLKNKLTDLQVEPLAA